MELSAIWEYLKTQALTNDFFSGAALAGIILGVLHQMRGYAAKAFTFVWNKCFVRFTVHSEDVLYRPISLWLKNNNFDKFARRYRLRVNPNDMSTSLGPDYGTFLFRAKNRWMKASIYKEQGVSATESNRYSQTRDFISISYFGLSQSLIDQIIIESLKYIENEEILKIPVCLGTGYGWIESAFLDKGGSKGIVLSNGLLESLENDVATFLSRYSWYEDRGIPYRRGYLFYGPPGTGKSSIAKHLASKFEMQLNVMTEKCFNGDVSTLIAGIAKNTILLIEDIDCIITDNRAKEKVDNSVLKPNLATVLNALDGVASKEGIIIIMTTNHPDRLDPALIRPGRIDYKLKLGYVSQEQAERLFSKFFPREDRASLVIEGEWTPAQLQEVFISCSTGAEAIERIKEGNTNGDRT